VLRKYWELTGRKYTYLALVHSAIILYMHDHQIVLLADYPWIFYWVCAFLVYPIFQLVVTAVMYLL
jgi:hypothetical protein